MHSIRKHESLSISVPSFLIRSAKRKRLRREQIPRVFSPLGIASRSPLLLFDRTRSQSGKKRDKAWARRGGGAEEDGGGISTRQDAPSKAISRVIGRTEQKNQRKGRLHRIRVTGRNSTAVISSRHSARSDGFYPITSHE